MRRWWRAEKSETVADPSAIDRSSAMLERLPAAVRDSARIAANGEVSWSLVNVAHALAALADAGFVVLGLDMRSHDNQGRIMEIPFADFSSVPMSPEQARDEALAALESYAGEYGDWVLVTWA